MQISVIKKTLLLSTLLFAASVACAEWVKATQSKESTFYIDPATIRKNGSLRTVWGIQDLRQRHPSGYMSVRSRWEFDCKNERINLMSTTNHSEPMAGGEELKRSQWQDRDWADIAPESVSDAILKIVCAN